MGLTPIHKTASVVSNEIGAVNIASRAISTVTNTASAVINRTSNAISKVFGGAGKILKNGLVAGGVAAAALTFPISAPAIYGALATGKFVKNKVEGKGRGESIGNAITRPLGADTVEKYTDFAKVGEGIKDMTLGAGGEVVKGAAELVTVPLIGAKFDDSSSSEPIAQAVSSPSSTESPAPSPSTPPSNPEQPKKQDTPIPVPIPTPSPSTPPSNPEQPKDQKKEEENQRKEEEKKKSEEVEKKSSSYNKSIDKVSGALIGAGGIKELVNSNTTELDKQNIIDGISAKKSTFDTEVKTLRNNIKTEIDSDLLCQDITYNIISNGATPPEHRIENLDKLKTSIKNSITLVDKMMDSDIGGIGEFEKVKGYDTLSDVLSELQSQKTIIERLETKPSDHTDRELASIYGIIKNFKKSNQGIDTLIRAKSDKINKELDDAKKILPNDITSQKTRINNKIDELNVLLSNSKNKVISKKGGFFSGKEVSLNKDEINEVIQDATEIMGDLESLLTASEKQIERKDVIKKIKPLFGKINEAFQALNA